MGEAGHNLGGIATVAETIRRVFQRRGGRRHRGGKHVSKQLRLKRLGVRG